MPLRAGRALRVPPIIGATLLALVMISLPSLAQEQILGEQDEIVLTPAQKAFVDKHVKSPGTVKVDVMKATGAETQGPPGDRYAKLVLPLREGKDITLVRTRPTITRAGGFTWRGEVEETGERAVLMLWEDGHLSGYFGYKGHVFSVNHIGDSVHTMEEIDPLKLPPDHAPGTQARSRGAPPSEPTVEAFSDAERHALEAKTITIDVMLLYTKKAASLYINDPGNLLALAIEQANETFRNSGIGNVSLRLVHSQLTDYDETDGGHFQHLYRMVDGEGVFKDLRTLRNEKGADVVGLVMDSASGCGLSTRVGADADEAFFVVHHACAAITISISHEIGHILGARHDRAIDSSNSPFAFGHGYINGAKWRTMMAYNHGCGGCPRIPYWSNPRALYKGEPTGTPAADNARVILEQAERVSNFR